MSQKQRRSCESLNGDSWKLTAKQTTMDSLRQLQIQDKARSLHRPLLESNEGRYSLTQTVHAHRLLELFEDAAGSKDAVLMSVLRV